MSQNLQKSKKQVLYHIDAKKEITSIVIPHLKVRFSKLYGLVYYTETALIANKLKTNINFEKRLNSLISNLEVYSTSEIIRSDHIISLDHILTFEILKSKILQND